MSVRLGRGWENIVLGAARRADILGGGMVGGYMVVMAVMSYGFLRLLEMQRSLITRRLPAAVSPALNIEIESNSSRPLSQLSR